jgi:hypothetical protein
MDAGNNDDSGECDGDADRETNLRVHECPPGAVEYTALPSKPLKAV